MADSPPTSLPVPSRRKLVASWGVMVSVGVFLMVGVILPAEFNLDPLGIGGALGIKGISSMQSTMSHSHDDYSALRNFNKTFELRPFESLEIKFELLESETMQYSWSSDSEEVLYELHSEPHDAEPGYADSYERDRTRFNSGIYVAEYDGIHGWFWENRASVATTISLHVSGFYTAIYEFRDGFRIELLPQD